jgi:acetylornithine deacetylase/succinyl-diaminopimelate desuccinylase-like protein
VLLGFGLPDDCIHAPDESLDLENFRLGQEALAAYWLELGAGGPR